MNASLTDAQNKLRELLQKTGKSLEEIAEELQTDSRSLSSILEGAKLKMADFFRILIASGCTIEVKPLRTLNRNRANEMPPQPLIMGAKKKVNKRGGTPTMGSPSPNYNLEELVRQGLAPTREEVAAISRRLGRPLTGTEINELIQRKIEASNNRNAEASQPQVNQPWSDSLDETAQLESHERVMTEADMGELINHSASNREAIPVRENVPVVPSNLDRRSMLEEIISNGWEREVNIYDASDRELFLFLESKKRNGMQSPINNEELDSDSQELKEAAAMLLKFMKKMKK